MDDHDLVRAGDLRDAVYGVGPRGDELSAATTFSEGVRGGDEHPDDGGVERIGALRELDEYVAWGWRL
ncbi:MAG: hypothetical protein M3Q31_03615 [Actinomycetota bacterium]|nr:hypothetical protein [Actinomycetota bacterium]